MSYTKRANASPFAVVASFLGGLMMGRARMVVGGVCLPVIVESNEAERAAQVESGAFQLCFVVQVLEPCRVANACEGGNVEGRVECNG